MPTRRPWRTLQLNATRAGRIDAAYIEGTTLWRASHSLHVLHVGEEACRGVLKRVLTTKTSPIRVCITSNAAIRTARRCCAPLSLKYRYGTVIINATSVKLDRLVEIIAACMCPIFVQRSFYFWTKRWPKTTVFYTLCTGCKVGQMKNTPKKTRSCTICSRLFTSLVRYVIEKRTIRSLHTICLDPAGSSLICRELFDIQERSKKAPEGGNLCDHN